MKYHSTRGAYHDAPLTFSEAVLLGLAEDGGLLVPQKIPSFDLSFLEKACSADKAPGFQELAFRVMEPFVAGDPHISPVELKTIVERSYSSEAGWRSDLITPLKSMSKKEDDGGNNTGLPSELHVLELWHGPTFAFKDVALQFLGNVFDHILSKEKQEQGNESMESKTGAETADAGKKMIILGATSGDTGSAAICGVRGKGNLSSVILFPEGLVSPIQELQMTTVAAAEKNIHCLAIKGVFDDCQKIVKDLFVDQAFRKIHRLGAVNSINWARILAQIVYYFHAYIQLRRKQVSNASDDQKEVVFVVPTGNFGDILAGYYAKRMGLPIARLVVATNKNDILHNFFETGRYCHPGATVPSLAPAMDISISSNFERFLFHLLEENGEVVNEKMGKFNNPKDGENRVLEVNAEKLAQAQKVFQSCRSDDQKIKESIRVIKEQFDYVCDPHTACGITFFREQSESVQKYPTIFLSCAHWAKFPSAIRHSVSEEKVAESSSKEIIWPKGMSPPEGIQSLLKDPKCEKTVVESDIAKVKVLIKEIA
eukprot:g4312.t1